MEETNLTKGLDQPEFKPEETVEEATIPNAETPVNETADFLEIKFNKENKMLDKETAAVLAQKGMKYDLVSGDFERLKSLSKNSGKSVSDYLLMLENKEKNEQIEALLKEGLDSQELIDRVINLKEKGKANEFEQLKAEFPEITNEEALPSEVKTAAETKGTGLLFEYLLHEHRLRRAAEEEKQRQAFSASASTGSLSDNDRQYSFGSEFIKGLWN